MTATLPLSPQVFVILRDLLEEHTGLHYPDDARDTLADRISPRAVERGFQSLLDYYYFLRYDAEGSSELETLVDSLVVNETYFFRETDALKMVTSTLVEPRVKAGRPVRIWSAACSTGEEAFTVAMLLDALGVLPHCEIVASDISKRALARAREGRYGGRSLRALPEGVLGRWLEPADNGVQVTARLSQHVKWRHVNLVDAEKVRALGEFDVILCRNVLIYFDDARVNEVVKNLTNSLRSDGALLVGVSESLMRFTTALRCEERAGVFVYRKAVA